MLVIFYYIIFLLIKKILNLDRRIIYRYEEKRWASKRLSQPTPTPSEINYSINHLLEIGSNTIDIPRKTRTFSLEEEILVKHVGQLTPPLSRPRAVSLYTLSLFLYIYTYIIFLTLYYIYNISLQNFLF